MAGRRSHPPLFEFLRKDSAQPPPSVRIEPARTRPEPPPPRKTPETPGSGVIRIPVYAFYLGVTAVLGFCVLVWALGFQAGRGRGEEQAMRQLGLTSRTPPRNPDPLVIDTPPVVSPNGTPPFRQTPVERDLTPPTPQPTPAPVASAFLGSAGAMASDPRQPGVNYLKIASRVSFDETRGILLYLKANGVEALGLRIDAATSGDNNGVYDIFTLMGVPSERYTAMAQERERHWNTIRRLGQVWRSEHKGTVDFAQPLWQLFR